MTPKELEQWFANIKGMLEPAYVAGKYPWQQSGVGLRTERTFEYWEALRKPVADCINKSGTFLDIGCANGFLLETVMHWVGERSLEITPFGLDISEKMVTLAKERLPNFADNIFVGNGWDWTPPQTFDYVRTELVYVPDELQVQYIDRLLEEFVAPGGSLLVADYQSTSTPENKFWVDAFLEEQDFKVAFTKSGFYEGIEGCRITVVQHRTKNRTVELSRP